MNKIPILTFHSVDPSGSVISVSSSQLDALFDSIEEQRYETLTVAEAAQRLKDGKAADKFITLTFDDGFANFHTEVFPRLAQRRMRATLYVVSERCGAENDWDARGLPVPRLPLLSWDQVAELHRAGHEIGAHSRTHPDLRAATDEDLRREIVECGEELADRLGVKIQSFAYPYGLFDHRACDLVRKHYASAVGTRLACAGSSDDPHALSRIDMYYLRGHPAMLHPPWREPYLAARRAARNLSQLLRARQY